MHFLALLLIIITIIPRQNTIADEKKYPSFMVWAWDRNEDLRFIDTDKMGVAYLAATINLNSDTYRIKPRLSSLKVPEGTYVIPVIRIEAYRKPLPELNAKQRAFVLREILRIAEKKSIDRIQIDFEVTSRQRNFYKGILKDLRKELPKDVSLTLTALTSWCYFDNWMNGEDVEEIVPMMFDMGADEKVINKMLMEEREFIEPLCKKSIGVSTYSPLTKLPRHERLYLFHSKPWTKQVMDELLNRVKNL